MKRILLSGLLILSLSGPLLARTVEERLISGLKSQGYVILEDSFTWLGRLRIVAENVQYRREIVVNPETGEVLRDYVVLLADLPARPSPGPNPAAVAGMQGGGGGASTSEGDGVVVTATTVREGSAGFDAGAGLVAGAPFDPQSSGTSDDLVLADPVLPLVTVAP